MLDPGRTQAMVELYSRALRAEDETELYKTIATWLPEVLPADRASVALVVEGRKDETGSGVLEVLGLSGTDGALARGVQLQMTTTRSGQAVRERKTQNWRVSEHLHDYSESGRLASIGIEGVLNAPLVVADTAIGSLNIARCAGGFNEDEANLLTDIANLLAMNLLRFQALARTRDELARSQRQLQRVSQLSSLGRRLSTATTVDEAFLQMADTIEDLLPSDRISLAVPDRDSGHFTITSLRQNVSTAGLERGTELPLEGSAIDYTMNAERACAFNDLSTSCFSEHRRLVNDGMRCAMSVPVFTHQQVGAVLNCSNDSTGYDEDDLVVAEAVATAVGETLERIEAVADLAARDRQLASIVDENPLLTMTVADDGEVLEVSRFGAHRIGHDPGELVGRRVHSLYPVDHHCQLDERLRAVTDAEPGTVMNWDAAMVDASGNRRWVRHHGRRLLTNNPAAVLIVCEDVSELQELTEKLEFEATHDPLTGLINRREFDRQLRDLAEADAQSAVLYIDLDQFKIVNDTAGHRAGDALLVKLTDLMQTQLHKADVLGRLGGDEFAVLLPNCTLSNAVRVAERLRKAACDLVFSWQGRAFGVALSIGVVGVAPELKDPDEVLARADAACYLAKRDGRNRVSVARGDRAGDPAARRDGEWGSRVRQAIANHELELVAQPIVPIGGPDPLHRAEMLVRLRESDGSLVPAGVFVPAAERLGLITEIDQWMINQVTSLMSANPEWMKSVGFLSVNLSARSIEANGFIDFLLEAITKPGVDPSKLLFEITETAALSQFSKAVRFVETASAVGCRFALDDFGAGFSTFHYLKRLPVDVLKIDGSLVKDLATEPIDQAIVSSVVSVARSLNMETIAEFVDDDATVAHLDSLGVTYAQGYHTGRPGELNEIFPRLNQ